MIRNDWNCKAFRRSDGELIVLIHNLVEFKLLGAMTIRQHSLTEQPTLWRETAGSPAPSRTRMNSSVQV